MSKSKPKIGARLNPFTLRAAEMMGFPDPAIEYIQSNIKLSDLAIKWRRFLNCSYPELRRRFKEENWKLKRAQFRDKLEKAVEETALEDATKMTERHLRGGQILQKKALSYIQQFGIGDDKVAVDAMKTGVDIERAASGQPEYIIGMKQMQEDDEDTLRKEAEELARSIPKTEGTKGKNGKNKH